MGRTRGFKLKIKLQNIFKWRTTHFNLPITNCYSNPFSKLFSLATASLSRRVSYVRFNPAPPPAPKGYLAVHVGGLEDETTERHLVPVIYFNHPLFGKLLQATERIYGFDNPGRIVIPVRVSEFQEVKNCIAAAEHARRRRN